MSLPPEIDFSRNPEASPARMNSAMEFLWLAIGASSALQPEFRTAIDQLKGIGLERLNEVLSPIFGEAQTISVQLATIQEQWLSGEPLEQLLADLTADVTGQLAGNAAAIAAQLAEQDAEVAAQLAVVASLGTMSSRAKAAVADLFAWNADKGLTTDLVGSAFAQQALAYSAPLAWDWRGGFYRGPVVCTGNVVIGAPTNVRGGETRIITLKGDGATARTISFNSIFKGALPDIVDLTSTKPYRLVIFADSTTELTVDAKALA